MSYSSEVWVSSEGRDRAVQDRAGQGWAGLRGDGCVMGRWRLSPAQDSVCTLAGRASSSHGRDSLSSGDRDADISRQGSHPRAQVATRRGDGDLGHKVAYSPIRDWEVSLRLSKHSGASSRLSASRVAGCFFWLQVQTGRVGAATGVTAPEDDAKPQSSKKVQIGSV